MKKRIEDLKPGERVDIPEKAKGFGPISISRDDDELTVTFGKFHHSHFTLGQLEALKANLEAVMNDGVVFEWGLRSQAWVRSRPRDPQLDVPGKKPIPQIEEWLWSGVLSRWHDHHSS